MTDIVERLRNLGWLTCHEAADEIERLRANEAAAIFSFRETNDMALEEIKWLRAKIKQYEDEQCASCRAYREIEARRALEPKP